MMGMALDDAHLKFVDGIKTAHEMWEFFRWKYGEATHTLRFSLIRQLFREKWTSGTQAEYIERIQDLKHRIINAKGDIPDEWLVCTIFSGMPDSWESFIAGLEGMSEDVLQPDVCQRLIAEGQRQKDREMQGSTTM